MRRLCRPGRLLAWGAPVFLLLCLSVPAGEPAGGTLRPASAKKGPKSGPAIPSTLIELDGSISSSPDGAELAYRWRQLSGPPVTLSNPAAAKPYFSTSEPGIYVFELVVTANELQSEPHVVQLEIEAENLPPVAKAPRELTGQVGKLLEVDGSDSFDPEGEELAYRWRPLTPGLDVPADELKNPVLTFEPAKEGVYEVELVVSDGELKSDPVVCRLTIKPQPKPPVARARVVTLDAPPEPAAPASRPGGTSAMELSVAAINASASLVPEERKPPLKPAGSPVAELAAMAPPAFPVRPEQRAAPPPFPSGAAPVRPVARIQGPATSEAGRAVVLDARTSYNPSGNRMDYRWRQTGGPLVDGLERVFDGAAERFTAPLPGEYEFELVVVDGGLESEPATHRMRVGPAPEPPVALVAAPSRAAKGQLVRMDATQSSDPSGGRLIYRWRQTGGPPVRNYVIDDRFGDAAPGFHPPAPGAYSFELIVSNGVLNSKPVEIDILVSDAALAPAVSIAGPKTARVGERVALDAVPVNVEGRTLSYLWQQVDGPALAMPQGGGMRTFVIPPVDGRYVFTLTALENGQPIATAVSSVDAYGAGRAAATINRAATPAPAAIGAGRVPELTPLPNTPVPRPPPLESFPPAHLPSANGVEQSRPAAQVMQGSRYGG